MAGDVRWADLLCPDCTDQVLAEPFSWGLRWKHLTQQDNWDCFACKQLLDEAIDRHGGQLQVASTFAYLPPSVRREMVAAHEAGHAVLGLEFGYPLSHAAVGSSSNPNADGEVWWDFNRHVVSNDEYGAMTYAGALAQRRWLEAQGYQLDVADLVDLSKGASEDIVGLVNQLGGLPTGALDKATDLISTHWQRIQHLGGELARTGHMDADHVHRALRALDRPRATPAPAPAPARPARHPTPQPAPAPTNTTKGTASMGIEEIRGLIAEVEQRNNTVASQLVQAKTEIEQAAGLLQHYLGQSSDSDVHTAIGQQHQISDQLDQLAGQLTQISTGLTGYAGRL